VSSSKLQVHTESKPPYSFSCLIFMAIEDSPIKALPVKDIYGWIVDHFPYYKNAPTGWKNSVRHNLSLNKCFRKVEKAPVSLIFFPWFRHRIPRCKKLKYTILSYTIRVQNNTYISTKFVSNLFSEFFLRMNTSCIVF